MSTFNPAVPSPFESKVIGAEIVESTERALVIDVHCRCGQFRVRGTRIIGTPHVVFSLEQPVDQADPWANHSSVFSGDDGYWGNVHTRRIPADLDALPAMTDERSAAVGEYHSELYAFCRNTIVIAVETVGSRGLQHRLSDYPMSGWDITVCWPVGQRVA